MTDSTLCQWREDGQLCIRMRDHVGNHEPAPDTSLVDPIYSELSTAEKIDQLYDRVQQLETLVTKVWTEVTPLLDDVVPMLEAVQNSAGFKMLVGGRAARQLKDRKGR